jgi:SAM-dependent methyltransferase
VNAYWATRRTPTLDPALLAAIPEEVPRWKVAYWQFQHALTRDHLLPFLTEAGALPGEGRILEVGAGEGGCLAALHAATGLPAHGVELSSPRTDLARQINAVLAGGALDLHVGDVTDLDSLHALEPPYSLIVLRDVIEHIEARDRALTNLRTLLAPGGYLCVTFPPYNSPFGAHQQVLTPRHLRLPWIQLWPGYLGLVARAETVPEKVKEQGSLRRCSCTVAGFERSAAGAGLRIVIRRHYLLRPAFRYRYGLPAVPAGILGRLPGVREVAVTGSWYLLCRD